MKIAVRSRVGTSKMSGFTLIEVMFVLAIAGLILLIVFEALPALQRSSRNNQRRQDVQTILEAVSHYELNDSGNFPADCTGITAPTACTNGVGTSNDNFLRYVGSKLVYYDAATSSNPVVLQGQTALATPGPNPVTTSDTVYVYNYQKCNSTGGGSTWQGAGHNDVVALYALESSNGATVPQCQQL
jgi:prepilin-type N-terminal cleavage/methylation domain-containing protein